MVKADLDVVSDRNLSWKATSPSCPAPHHLAVISELVIADRNDACAARSWNARASASILSASRSDFRTFLSQTTTEPLHTDRSSAAAVDVRTTRSTPAANAEGVRVISLPFVSELGPTSY